MLTGLYFYLHHKQPCTGSLNNHRHKMNNGTFQRNEIEINRQTHITATTNDNDDCRRIEIFILYWHCHLGYKRQYRISICLFFLVEFRHFCGLNDVSFSLKCGSKQLELSLTANNQCVVFSLDRLTKRVSYSVSCLSQRSLVVNWLRCMSYW